MAYEDPLAARYERVNLSLNAYEMEAIRKTCRAFKKTRADLLYRWVFEPESKIANDSRNFFHETLNAMTEESIQACA